MDSLIDCIGIFLVAVLLALLGFCFWGLYDNLTAETFNIRKDEFTCTASHTVLIKTLREVCDQYTRKGR